MKGHPQAVEGSLGHRVECSRAVVLAWSRMVKVETKVVAETHHQAHGS